MLSCIWLEGRCLIRWPKWWGSGFIQMDLFVSSWQAPSWEDALHLDAMRNNPGEEIPESWFCWSENATSRWTESTFWYLHENGIKKDSTYNVNEVKEPDVAELIRACRNERALIAHLLVSSIASAAYYLLVKSSRMQQTLRAIDSQTHSQRAI